MDEDSPLFWDHVFCFSSIDDLFDYFYDRDVSYEELEKDLNTEQKIRITAAI